MAVESLAQSEPSPSTRVSARRPAWCYYDGIYGESPYVHELRSFIERAANLREPVLLLGEEGLRHEQFARAVHHAGSHWSQPFLAINARKLGDEALHGLLFGQDTNAGLLATVKGGTVYVSDLMRLSPVLQQRLAVFLEERTWLRHGNQGTRLILAANIQTEERTVSNRIAFGLVEMLRAASFTLLPLRARRADIPFIAKALLDRLAQERSLGAAVMTDETVQALLGYDWPDNLDELESVLRAALAYVPCRQISETELPPHIRFAGLRTIPPEGIDLTNLLDGYERHLLATALQQTGKSQTKAAQLLGIRVQTLNMKLKRLAEQGRPLL